MADQELRQRRVGQEVQEARKKQRAARVYKIDKASEPTSWCFIITIVLIIIALLLFVVEAISGFKRVKMLF